LSANSGLLTRVATAVPLGLGLLAAIYWAPPLLWIGLIGLVTVLAAVEWAGMAGCGRKAGLLYGLLVVAISTTLIMLAPTFSAPYFPALLFWLFVPVILARGIGIRPASLHLTLGGILLVPTHLGMVALRELSPDLVLVVVGIVVVADTAAYFSGRRFGRRKLAPSISPGKTWEGAIGAALAITLYALLLHQFAGDALKLPGLAQTLVLLWLLFVLSVLGDLFESALKRQAGIKDSGTLLPGHGGVLDRIDSLTAVLPAATLFWIYSQ
jgi:phosphatidate cytidylyltransferase